MSAVTTAMLRAARARIAAHPLTGARRQRFALEYLDLVQKAPTPIRAWAWLLDELDPTWTAARRAITRRTLDELVRWQLTDAGRRALDNHRAAGQYRGGDQHHPETGA